MNMLEDRKYFDYELAYETYKKAKKIFDKGGLQALKKVFEIEELVENGYLVAKDYKTNTWVYLYDKNFDTNKKIEFYVCGEVDVISYIGECDNLYINSISVIQDRIEKLWKYAKENDYSIEDYTKELESLLKVLKDLQRKDSDLDEDNN